MSVTLRFYVVHETISGPLPCLKYSIDVAAAAAAAADAAVIVAADAPVKWLQKKVKQIFIQKNR